MIGYNLYSVESDVKPQTNKQKLSDWSEISSNGTSRSPQMKSVPFGNFNMCNKFDFKMFKISVSIRIKTHF